MDVFDRYLKAIKELGLCVLHFRYEVLCEIFVYNPVAGGKEGQDVCDEMTFAIVQGGPVAQIVTQVYLFRCPETSLGLFIELPDVVLLDRKEHETIFVLPENRFLF